MTPLDELLGRVDAELDAWEASPHSWSPGDPLYTRPTCTDDCDARLDACTVECMGLPACGHECDHQVMRPLVEIFDERDAAESSQVSTRWLRWCKACQVGWSPDASPLCWVCGVDEREALSRRMSELVTTQLVGQDVGGAFRLDAWQTAMIGSLFPATVAAAITADEEQARRRVLEQ